MRLKSGIHWGKTVPVAVGLVVRFEGGATDYQIARVDEAKGRVAVRPAHFAGQSSWQSPSDLLAMEDRKPQHRHAGNRTEDAGQGDDVLVVRGPRAGLRGRLIHQGAGKLLVAPWMGPSVAVDPRHVIVAERRHGNAAPAATSDALREAYLKEARNAGERADRMIQSFSGTDQAESEAFRLVRLVWIDLYDGKDLEESLARHEAVWRKYAAEQARKVAAAPKLRRGPSSGHSVISHRWVSPDYFQGQASHIRTMARILRERVGA